MLAISQNAVRLVEVSAGDGAHTVRVADLHDDAASAVGLPSIGGRSPSGRIQGSEGQKVRLGQYSRAVDAAIRPIVSGTGIPLIVAVTEPLTGIYRLFNNDPGFTAQTIDGNPDQVSYEDLAASAATILDEVVRRALLSGARVLVVRGADDSGVGPAAANVRFAV